MYSTINRIVGNENLSQADLDIEAYSYDASCMKQKPSLVVWPRDKEHIRKILIYCNRTNTSLVCRGHGTNLVGSAIGENAVILDFSKMSSILKLDLRTDCVDVEPGISVDELNHYLKKKDKFFPIFPEEFPTTIGGIIAMNLYGPYSVGLGRIDEQLIELDCFDGTGKFFSKADPSEIIGWEGTTAIITRARIKIYDWPMQKSADLLSFKNLPVMFNKLNALSKNHAVLSVEFFDKTSAQHMNLDPKYTLLVEYSDTQGEIDDQTKIQHLVQKRKKLYSTLRTKGYYHIEDPKLPLEKLYDLINWSEKHNLPAYGHISFGVLKIMFKKEQTNLREELYLLVRDWKGLFSGIYGYGLKRKHNFPPALKHKLIKLKEKKDYNNILNKGKLIDFI